RHHIWRGGRWARERAMPLYPGRPSEEWGCDAVFPTPEVGAISAGNGEEAPAVSLTNHFRGARSALGSADAGHSRWGGGGSPPGRVTPAGGEGAPGGLGRTLHDDPAQWATPRDILHGRTGWQCILPLHAGAVSALFASAR